MVLHKNKISACIHINVPVQDESFMPVLECDSNSEFRDLTFHNWRLLIGECLRMLWQLR